ncbi:unnamed protein product [Sphenostylis stenocarpa]|uniref:Uncharacterized protein n=1 Tax=Sphenostylis stenocarpa TaxID=92480 RepID=A0AA86VU01_9FABA|nr:unnamed protein product [Sphenostylis stenocarpa]
MQEGEFDNGHDGGLAIWGSGDVGSWWSFGVSMSIKILNPEVRIIESSKAIELALKGPQLQKKRKIHKIQNTRHRLLSHHPPLLFLRISTPLDLNVSIQPTTIVDSSFESEELPFSKTRRRSQSS